MTAGPLGLRQSGKPSLSPLLRAARPGVDMMQVGMAARTLGKHCVLAIKEHRLADALTAARLKVDLLQALDEPPLFAAALHNLRVLLDRTGDPSAAEPVLLKAVEMARVRSDPRDLQASLDYLADVRRRLPGSGA